VDEALGLIFRILTCQLDCPKFRFRTPEFRDQLKAASDLGVPVVGIGLLYQQGYFRQVIDEEGEGAN
jgi:hypothetical protein